MHSARHKLFSDVFEEQLQGILERYVKILELALFYYKITIQSVTLSWDQKNDLHSLHAATDTNQTASNSITQA